MNLEQLTKHQIVLLTLLVSFMTSIATGIVTVSLMGQAPPSVTRVVNQIVEHTVEKIVPSTQGAAAATTEKTVVVKDDDLTAQSIAKVQKGVIRITIAGSDLLVARGVIIDAKGTALTDKAALAGSGSDKFEAILATGERVPATMRASSASTSDLVLLDLATGTTTGWAPVPLADQKKLALGQSVIRIGGKGSDTVGSGVIATLSTKESPDLIASSVSAATPGSILMTIFGEVIGLSTETSLAAGSEFYTIATVPPPPSPKAADAASS
jgi:hypothetical protein